MDTVAGSQLAPVEGPRIGRTGPPTHQRRRWTVLAVLCVSLLIVSLDNTVLNVALPTLVRRLHATNTQLQWIVDAYAIVFAGLLLVFGSLGDRVGRKWVFMLGLVVFASASAVSAFSSTPEQLIAARAFMGVGAAGIMPSTLSILTNVFTDAKDRARAIGVWSGTTGLGVALGPIVGGWLLARYWWGSVFLINVPIAAVGLMATTLLVPNSRNPDAKRPDPLGAILSIAGLSLLLWGIIEAPQRGWSSPIVLGASATALGIISVFVWWEQRCTHPMLELRFFDNRRFSVAMVSMAMVMFALMGSLFLLTQYLQFSLGYSALQTGLRIGPVALVLLVVSPASAFIVRRVGTKPVVATGMAVIAVGMTMLSRVSVHGTYGDVYPAFLLLGLGVGLSFAPLTESVMGSLPLERAGVGSGTNGAALQVGGALGVGVLGSIFNSRYHDRLAPALAHYPVPSHVLQVINGSLGGALAVADAVGGKLGAGLAALARRAFASGFDLALTVGAGAVICSCVLVIALLPNRARPGPPAGGADRPDPPDQADQTEERVAAR